MSGIWVLNRCVWNKVTAGISAEVACVHSGCPQVGGQDCDCEISALPRAEYERTDISSSSSFTEFLQRILICHGDGLLFCFILSSVSFLWVAENLWSTEPVIHVNIYINPVIQAKTLCITCELISTCTHYVFMLHLVCQTSNWQNARKVGIFLVCWW